MKRKTIIVIVIIVLAISLIGYFMIQGNKEAPNKTPVPANPTTQ